MTVTIQWMTVEEAAGYLRLSRRTIYKMVQDGRLPAYRIGTQRHRRFRKDDLDNALQLDVRDGHHEKVLGMTAKEDPLLAQVWDNDKDAAYDEL